MNSPAPGQLRREPFPSPSEHANDVAWEEVILRMLIGQDGSTTRLLETMAGERISVHIIEQRVLHELPQELTGDLPGNSFLRRVVALEAKGHVLLDSISYIAMDALPEPISRELQEGVLPIGTVLSRLWTRRTFRDQDTNLFEQLWSATGHPDRRASRSSCLHTPNGPCIILGETFRHGVLALIAGARRVWRSTRVA
jgi:chorismate-pyruvate lyase